MVNLSMKPKDNSERYNPDIFRAARNDDPVELADALEVGQSLDTQNRGLYNMTPIHLACAKHSLKFLRVALRENFNAWSRDAAGRVSMDYAVAEGLEDVADQLFKKLYPTDPAGRPVMPF